VVLHRIDPKVQREEQFGVLRDLQQEGRVGLSVSQVSVEEIEAAREIVEIVGVQNRYNPGERSSDEVLRYCETHDIAFIPWAPLAQGGLAYDGPLAEVARGHGVEVRVVALAWLLARSLPIPGTSRVAHPGGQHAGGADQGHGDELAAIEAATA
jgi:pyridoxine 4-dehydrogenase